MTRQTRLLVLAVVATCPLAKTTHRAHAQQPVRPLAPGILTVISPEPKTEETSQGPLPLRSVTRMNWDPNYLPKTQTLGDKASKVVLRRNIWNLEFAFKPLRMIYVDIPQPTGKMHRKLIWYMVFRVRNLGQHLTPNPVRDQFKHIVYDEPKKVNEVLNLSAAQPTGTIRFFPHFVLESREQGKEYLDRLIPEAIPWIQRREMRGAGLFNTIEISRIDIPVSTPTAENAVWGVVTWEGIDPRTDYFSVYVQGLTNAYWLKGTPNGVDHQLKTLQLNFWRPGDMVLEHEKEIRYGIPSVSNPAEQAGILAKYGPVDNPLRVRVDHRWVYR